jgi:2-polyprenyl-6-methoxyphenol hydroxylase-like FAD-dependent oxidoreductase
MRVIVIGSGIGGLATAIALRRVGIGVTVYERAPALGEVGAGISLWANAIRALEHLGAAGPVTAAALPFTRSEFRVADGHRVLARYTADELARRANADCMVRIIHRADLVAALAGQLPPDTTKYGHECVSVETVGDRATVRFANGHADEADLIVGADGIKSVVRTAVIGPEKPPRYAGYPCWRGLCPRPPGMTAGLTGEWWGRGRRFGITCLPGDRVYWYATANAPSGERGDEAAILAKAFAGWAEPVPELIATTPPGAVLRNDCIDRPPNPTWVNGRLVLVGDAAHPTTPNLGQGGCMAIEDAVVLARQLRGTGPLADRLAAFVAERYPRTTAITKESWKFGAMGQWQGRVSCWVRDRFLGVAMQWLGASMMAKHATFDVGPLPAA